MSETNDEISISQFIGIFKSYARFVWSKKLFIISFSILLGLLYFYREYNKVIYYTASVDFLISEDDGGSMAGIGAILGQIGVGGGSSENYAKVAAITFSENLLTKVVLDSITLNGKKNLVGNHIIDVYELHEKWEDKEELSSFYFNGDTLDETSLVVLKNVTEMLRGNPKKNIPGLLQFDYDDESTLLQIKSSTVHEDLSLLTPLLLYNNLQLFYDGASLERKKSTFNKMKDKSDSIRFALKQNQANLADLKDKSNGLVLNKSSLKRNSLEMEAQILAGMIGEVEKNRETADFLLSSESEYFKTLDLPYKPLDKTKKNLILQVVMGMFTGIFLSIVFFVFQYFIRLSLKA